MSEQHGLAGVGVSTVSCLCGEKFDMGDLGAFNRHVAAPALANVVPSLNDPEGSDDTAPPVSPDTDRPDAKERPVGPVRIRSANCAEGDHGFCATMVEQDVPGLGITECLCQCHAEPDGGNPAVGGRPVRAGDWRHATWCAFRLTSEAACTCGLDAFREALNAESLALGVDW